MSEPEIKTIRQIRRQISAECGHDVDRVVAYYRAAEDEFVRSGEFRLAEAPDDSTSRTDTVDPSLPQAIRS